MRGLLLVILLAFLVFIALQTGFFSKKESLPQKMLNANQKVDKLVFESDIKHLTTAIQTYYSDSGKYPRSFEELIPFYLRTETECLDAWGQKYRMEVVNETDIFIISAGKDKIFDTSDDLKRRIQ
jgi:hypothetical protein